MKDLEKELSERYPNFQKDLETLNKMEKMKPAAADYSTLASQLKHAQSVEQLYQEVIKTIKEFREKWNNNNNTISKKGTV